ncbi:DUF5994 family protein [Streptomyces sp. NPDC101132]|uniref:DUF5994 family protein n=1 Tax=Streptomyces sp. NPDC101132 TaxID=3366110 RepID=UPI00382A9931
MAGFTDPFLPARLALTPTTSLSGLLDGAWWPYSDDLAVELPRLVAALRARWGPITRITANPGPWPAASYRVRVDGLGLRIGWFTEQDRDTMILFSSGRLGRCDLLVIPPGTEPASAARLMAAASAPGNLHTSETLMSDESGKAHRAGHRAGAHRGREAAPSADGGALMQPRTPRQADHRGENSAT